MHLFAVIFATERISHHVRCPVVHPPKKLDCNTSNHRPYRLQSSARANAATARIEAGALILLHLRYTISSHPIDCYVFESTRLVVWGSEMTASSATIVDPVFSCSLSSLVAHRLIAHTNGLKTERRQHRLIRMSLVERVFAAVLDVL